MSIHSRGRSFDETSTKLRRLSYSQKWNFDQTSTKLRQVFGIDLQCFESVFGQLFVIHALWNCQSNSFFVAVSHLSERCALERYFETDTRERSFWEIYLWEILESYFYERYLRLTFERDMFEEVLRHSWVRGAAYMIFIFERYLRLTFERCVWRDPERYLSERMIFPANLERECERPWGIVLGCMWTLRLKCLRLMHSFLSAIFFVWLKRRSVSVKSFNSISIRRTCRELWVKPNLDK